jgi:two-component system, OmpR family, sensor kinase
VRRPLRLGVRTRLLLAAVGAVAVALVVGVAAFNLVLGRRLSDGAVSLARGQAEAELASLTVIRGSLVVREGLERRDSLGSPVWVFDGTRVVEAPRATEALTAAARSLAGGPEGTLRVNESLRLYAIPVHDRGVRIGTVVAGVPLAAYDETATTALVGSIGLAAVILAAVALLSHWILGKALLPVQRMTEDAAAWSEHDLDRRFDRGEPYDELTRLAATLDALLERLAASLRHEQRLTAEVSHELRTPLARIAAESELALRREREPGEYRESLEAVHRNAEQMTRAVEALLAAARQDGPAGPVTSDARAGVAAAVEALREEARDAGIELTLSMPPQPIPVAVDEALLERIVHPLVENALRYGRAHVTVGLAVTGTVALVEVRDDGIGLEPGEAQLVFEPGARGSAAVAERRGAGLGLALARRLARSAGGDVVATTSGTGGRFALRLPLA